MNDGMIRLLMVAGLLWFVFQGTPGVGPAVSSRYEGPMGSLHSAAASMEPKDRTILAEALTAAGQMLTADRLKLVSTTEELQRYVKAVTEFDYVSHNPARKYPAVAAAITQELDRVIGKEVAPVTEAMRQSVAAALTEAGKATR